MSLPKANRLRRRQDFNAVYQKGRRRRSSNLTLVAMRQSQSKFSTETNGKPQGACATVKASTRIGISISQKVSKRAVVRNRIKRRIRAAFLQLLPRLSSGWSLVVVVQPQATRCDYFQFLQELEQLLTDAEVLDGYS